MGDNYPVVRVAVVQAAPVLFDREATIEKACRLIVEAGTAGARLILLPEALCPRLPAWVELWGGGRQPEPAGRASCWQRLLGQLGRCAQPGHRGAGRQRRDRRALYLAIGVIERDGSSSRGTLYCTLLYFGPDGRLLGKHRKLKPTGSERLIWGEGDGSTLTVVETEMGTDGRPDLLGELYAAGAMAAMYGKGVEIYLAPTADARDTWHATLQHIACEGRCFVLGCNQFVTKEMYPDDPEIAKELADQPEIMCRGGSAVVSPLGEVLAGPLYDQEGVLYADLDLAQVVHARYDFDPVGHYARPDVFRLLVNERAAVPTAPMIQGGRSSAAGDPEPVHE